MTDTADYLGHAIANGALVASAELTILQDPAIHAALVLATVSVCTFLSHALVAIGKAAFRKGWARFFPKDPLPAIAKESVTPPPDNSSEK